MDDLERALLVGESYLTFLDAASRFAVDRPVRYGNRPPRWRRLWRRLKRPRSSGSPTTLSHLGRRSAARRTAAGPIDTYPLVLEASSYVARMFSRGNAFSRL
jgi:hypothetical protein